MPLNATADESNKSKNFFCCKHQKMTKHSNDWNIPVFDTVFQSFNIESFCPKFQVTHRFSRTLKQILRK